MEQVVMDRFLNSKNTRRILILIRDKLLRLVQDYADYQENIVLKKFFQSRLHHVFEFSAPIVRSLEFKKEGVFLNVD